MASRHASPWASSSPERGFGLLDLAVAAAILCAFVLATLSVAGLRSPRTHPAALALEAALVEARSLALTTADTSDPTHATGATVVVGSDPLRPGGSTIAVYRSRPIANSGLGAPAVSLPPDAGFPPQHVRATFTVTPGTVAAGSSFAILLSSSGYASIADPYAFDPATPALLASDPGCSDSGVTITVSDGSNSEAHPLHCRDGTYDPSVSR